MMPPRDARRRESTRPDIAYFVMKICPVVQHDDFARNLVKMTYECFHLLLLLFLAFFHRCDPFSFPRYNTKSSIHTEVYIICILLS